MSEDVEHRLDVVADLRLDIDGVQAQVSANGTHIEVRTDDARRLAAALSTALPAGLGSRPSIPALRRAAAGLADALDAARLTTTVSSGNRPLLRLGHGVNSGLGRITVGTRRVQPVVGRRRVVLAAAAVTAGLIVVLGRSARR